MADMERLRKSEK